MELNSFFSSLQDPRRKQGQRYPLEAMLWMIFISLASGYHGYRKIAKFCQSNSVFFAEYFGLRHGVPSHVSFRSLLMSLDKVGVGLQFNALIGASVALKPDDWVCGDGQALRSTVIAASTSSQDFCSVVSLYCQSSGLTCAMQDYKQKKDHEGEVLRDLLDNIRAQGVNLTLDALHCQKKQ